MSPEDGLNSEGQAAVTHVRKQDLCFGLALGHHVSGSCTSVQETKAKLA